MLCFFVFQHCVFVDVQVVHHVTCFCICPQLTFPTTTRLGTKCMFWSNRVVRLKKPCRPFKLSMSSSTTSLDGEYTSMLLLVASPIQTYRARVTSSLVFIRDSDVRAESLFEWDEWCNCVTSKVSALAQKMKAAFSANMELPSVAASMSVCRYNPSALREIVCRHTCIKASAHSPIRIRAP